MCDFSSDHDQLESIKLEKEYSYIVAIKQKARDKRACIRLDLEGLGLICGARN